MIAIHRGSTRLRNPVLNVNPLKMDPTRTATLRRAWTADFNRKFTELARRIVKLVDTDDSFSLSPHPTNPFVGNAAWGFQSSAEQVNAFKAWMQQQVNILLLADGQQAWWRKYIVDGFKKGQGRVFDDFKMEGKTQAEKDLLKSAFNNPVSQDRVDVIAARVFTELEGVTDAMAQQITRVLTDGLTQGKNPKQIAKDMVDRVDKIGKNRARMISQTEIIRAHAEGQLTELERMGVQHVGVQVEFSAAHKGACPICQAKNNKKYTLAQARGVIPVHVCCRCCWRPSVDTDVLIGPEPVAPEPIVETPPEPTPTPKQTMWQKAKKFITGNQERVPMSTRLWTILRQLFNEPTDNFNPSHDGKGRFARGSGHADGGAKFLGSLTHVKSLGGSTGASLVQDEHGHQYVMKKGTSEGHIRAEFAAEQAYRAMGVKVPRSKLYETPDGPVKISRFVKGTELGKLTTHEQNHIKTQLQKNFAAHALLANWDVVGMGKDNILVSVKGGVYQEHHIDAGGSLEYRAKGGLKGAKWNAQATEFNTMRNSKNSSTESVFGSMTNQQIKDSVAHVVAHKAAVLAALPEKYHQIISQRIASLQKQADALGGGHVPAAPAAIPKPVESTPSSHSSLNTGDALAAHIKANHGEAGFTKLHLDKVKYLNQHGIVGGVFFMGKTPTAALDNQQAEHLKKILPAGTVIKKVDIKGHQMEAGWYPIGHKMLHKDTTPTPAKPETTMGGHKTPLQQAGEDFTAITKHAQEIADKSPMAAGELYLAHYFKAHKDKYGKSPTADETEDYKAHMKFIKAAKLDADFIPPSVKQSHDIFGNPAKKVVTKEEMWKPGADQSHVNMTAAAAKLTTPTKAVEQWKSGLKGEEKHAIADWKSNSYGIRKTISSNPPPPPQGAEHNMERARHFYNAIAKAPQVQGTVFRGLGHAGQKHIDKIIAAGEGGHWADQAPMCMSPSFKTAHGFGSGHIMLKIVTKTGRTIKHEDGHVSESEVTAMPGTTHRIVAIKKDVTIEGKHYKHYAELEEI